MQEYRVKRINLNHVADMLSYQNAVNRATVHYCKGLKELRAYCGGKLHRQRNGYSGINGNIEYVAERC